ncbi:MAG: hypothetical protein ACRDL0_22490 [Thermoleophilaceae bacterium]
MPHTIRTGQVILSASRLQPSRRAWSIRGDAAGQLAAPRIWWASSSVGMCSKLVRHHDVLAPTLQVRQVSVKPCRHTSGVPEPPR